jgi:exodeoxyribonuclease V alpha subunit
MFRPGIAKANFVELHQSSPWRFSPSSIKGSPWPILDNLLTQNKISYLDYLLTLRLFKDCQDVDVELAILFCHLIQATKAGHLCIRIDHEILMPAVRQLWTNENRQVLSSEEEQNLTRSIIDGAKKFSSDLKIGELDSGLSRFKQVWREGNDFYLQRYWVFESLFLQFLHRHLNTDPLPHFEPDVIKNLTDKLCQDKILLPEQAQAVMKGCLGSLTLICGGPGTGKTYTAGHLIKTFWESLSDNQKQTCQIVLAAPTGKAASNLQKSLSQALSGIKDVPSIEAKTLHALLGMRKDRSYEEAICLSADLVIIDESSMIDVRLMAK